MESLGAFFRFALAGGLLAWTAVSPGRSAAADRPGGVSLTRTRAALVALLAARAESGEEAAGRSSLEAVCRSLVREGGFRRDALLESLDMADDAPARAGRLLHSLDRLAPETFPRSTDADTDAALPPSPETSSPDALLLSLPLAIAYAGRAPEGVAAAGQLAAALEPDPEAAACARAAGRAVQLCLLGETDRRRILDAAARACGDEGMARTVRAARLTPWEETLPESRPRGRLQRALKAWFASTSYADALRRGEGRLLHPGSRRYLAVLAGATYDLSGEPHTLVWSATGDKETEELILDLEDLQRDGVLRPVRDARPAPDGPVSERRERSGGGPEEAASADAPSKEAEPTPGRTERPSRPTRPPRPARPTRPQRPARPGAGNASPATTPSHDGSAAHPSFPKFPKWVPIPNFDPDRNRGDRRIRQ